MGEVNDKPVFDLGANADTDPGLDTGVDIGILGDPPLAGRDLQQVRSPESQAKRSGLLLALAAIGLAIGALVAIPLLSRGGDDAANSQAPESVPDQPVSNDSPSGSDAASPETASNDSNGSDSSDDSSDSVAPSGGFVFEPPSAGHLRSDQVASLFSSDIDIDGTQYGVAYVAGGDLTVLDYRGITVPDLEVASDFATVANLALLTSGGRTWAITPDNRDDSFLVSNIYVVVEAERAGVVAVINTDASSEVGFLAAGMPVPGVPLPEGAELLWVQGRGVLVLPRTGGTFEISGIATSLTQISEARAVAASAGTTVYEECDDQLSCTYFSQGPDGVVVDLLFPKATNFNPSPDGEWILATTDNETFLFATADGTRSLLSPSPATAIAWSPDSSFVGIVNGDNGDVLNIVYPGVEPPSVVTMRLNAAPDDGALLVFRD